MESKLRSKEDIVSRLRKTRKKAGDTQAECADKVGISRVYYNRIESETGSTYPKEDFLKKFSKVYNINLDWLITGYGVPDLIIESNTPQEHNRIENYFELSLVNNTKKFVNLQTEKLFEMESLDIKEFTEFFHSASAILDITFRLLGDAKECKTTKESFPNEMAVKYQNEFSNIIKQL